MSSRCSDGSAAATRLPHPTRPPLYVTADRKVAVVDDGRPLSRWEQVATSYRFRYDVDMSDHRRTVELRGTPFSARGNRWHFEATVEVGFRVHDPAEIVKRNVKDALPIVYGYLRQRLAEITPTYDIQEAAEAEDNIIREFSGGRRLPEGITIFHVAPRLRPEAKAIGHVAERTEMRDRYDTNENQHELNKQEAVHQGELAQLTQEARLAAEGRELAAIGSAGMSAKHIVLMHLARHPQDTERALGLLMAHEQAVSQRLDADNQHSMEFFQFLVDKKIVRPDQVELMVPGLVSRIGGAATSTPVAARPAIWSQHPALSDQAAQPGDLGAGGPPPATLMKQDPQSRVWRPVDGVQPIYVLVDESTEMGPYVSDLSDGAYGLYQQLLEAKDASSAVLLSMLGFADQVATRLPLKAVNQGGQPPWFTARGPVSYASVFEALLDRIGPDVEALKAQGYTVLRPVVHLLAGSDPGNGAEWAVPYRRLIDSSTHRYAPNIVACGFGTAPARLIAEIATRPQSGHLAPPHLDPHQAIECYWQAFRPATSSPPAGPWSRDERNWPWNHPPTPLAHEVV